MNFNTEKPIYRQIIDYAFACILSGKWEAGSRVPSVRELAVEMSVNTHTVLKAYDYLTMRDIIYVRRGMGYFLADDARKKVDTERCEYFYSNTLNETFRQMHLLNIPLEEIIRRYTAYTPD